MNNKKNLISAIIYRLVYIVYGLIVPRLILGAFGSELNGLVSSIVQFLSFISLLEGGLGAVVLAELYAPIEEKDTEKTRQILIACQRMFLFIGLAFVVYTFVVAIGFAITSKGDYDTLFIITLVIAISLATIAQYLFAFTYKLYLQADQKLYIVNNVSSLTYVVNIIVTVIVIHLFPEIRVLKLAASIAFLIQPLIYRHYIDKEFRKITSFKEKPTFKLRNRWSGFAQNLAHFINMNTDVVVITVFLTFVDVSIYSIYMLAITAIWGLITGISYSYSSALGKYYAQGDIEGLKASFDSFFYLNGAASLVLYNTCLLLINPFVLLYTNNVSDANYYQPVFALIMIVAYLIYCLREPYRLLVLAAGKFRQTNFGSILEAVINIVTSVILIQFLGITGVAIGTLIAISYRYFYFLYYLKKDVIFLKVRTHLRFIIVMAAVTAVNIAVYFFVPFQIGNMFVFALYGVVIVVVEAIITFLPLFGFKRSLQYAKRLLRIKG